MSKRTLPFGTWPSDLRPDMVAGASRRFGGLAADAGHLYWSEGRPEEGGRQTLMRWSEAEGIEELLAAPFSARSKVHEYGGGEFIAAGGVIYFVNGEDQDVYALSPGRAPQRITFTDEYRFADMCHDANRHRLVAVAERHESEGEPHAYPDNLLVAIGLGTERRGRVTPLATDRGFYASPRLSPDGTQLAFLAWDLPEMPWDAAELWLADLDEEGAITRQRQIAGGDGTCLFQPEWHEDGMLYAVWDAGGWSNLYRLAEEGLERGALPRAAELARPLWVFGVRSYAFLDRTTAICAYQDRGVLALETVDIRDAAVAPVKAPIADLDRPVPFDGGLCAIVALADAPPAIARLSLSGDIDIIRSASDGVDLAYDDIATGRPLHMADPSGNAVFATYYAPTSRSYAGPAGSAPPAILQIHGGPTSSAGKGLSLATQFWTTRGFAVVDLDYAGSTGYGREHRQRLDGQWGVADVSDAASAAQHLAREGLADPERIVISGGSAGGYTVLMALATTQSFAAGSSRYGIADLALLQEHTHKFEGGYLYRLLGTTPESAAEVFKKRSPLTHVAGMTRPVILFQGLEDKVVPPEQSRLIADELRQRGIEVELHEFEGEGHGFRKAETIIRMLEAELAFYTRVLGLDTASA